MTRNQQEIEEEIQEKKDQLENFGDDPEASGIRLSIKSQINDLKTELKNLCNHDNAETMTRTNTTTTGTKTTTITTCLDCGHVNKEIERERTQEAKWI